MNDKAGRGRLRQTAHEFREAVGQLSAPSTRAHIEAVLQNEPVPENTGPGPEPTAADPLPTAEPPPPADAQWDQHARLVVPTRKKYANMWQPAFWQEWNPMDWCYGDCVYGDGQLNVKPYTQTSFPDWCTHVHLREELEYDMYEGESYKACHYGKPLAIPV